MFLTEYICKYIYIIHCNIWLNTTGMTHFKIAKCVTVFSETGKIITIHDYFRSCENTVMCQQTVNPAELHMSVFVSTSGQECKLCTLQCSTQASPRCALLQHVAWFSCTHVNLILFTHIRIVLLAQSQYSSHSQILNSISYQFSPKFATKFGKYRMCAPH